MAPVIAVAATVAIPLVGFFGAPPIARWRHGRRSRADWDDGPRPSRDDGPRITATTARKAAIYVLPQPPKPTRWERAVYRLRYGRALPPPPPPVAKPRRRRERFRRAGTGGVRSRDTP